MYPISPEDLSPPSPLPIPAKWGLLPWGWSQDTWACPWLSGDSLLTCGLAAAHTPDNSFMGFVSEELNETEKQVIKSGKASNMAVVYGKEASIWKVSSACV